MGGEPAGRGRRRRIKRRFVWVLGLAGLLLLAGGIYGGSLVYRLITGIQAGLQDPHHADEQLPVHREPLAPDEPLHILVLGVDEGLVEGGGRVAEGARRSDANLLLTIDKLTGHVGLLWIPRDMYVEVPQAAIAELTALRGRNPVRENPTKMGHVHAFGGPMLAMATVSDTLGVPVKRFVRLDFKGFERLIDLLGGVEIHVEQPMIDQDPYQDLYINIPAGRQTLNGRQALHYVRYRGDDKGDIPRIGRQQQFVKALAEQVLRLNMLTRLPDLVDELTASVTTDLSTAELLDLLRQAAARRDDWTGDRLVTGMVPGKPAYINGVSYWQMDDDELEKELEQVVWGVDPEANAQIKVAIYNSGGYRLREALSRLGYQVILLEPQGEPGERTQVIGRMDAADVDLQVLARHLARLVPAAEFYRQDLDDDEVDAMVILGRDYGPRADVPALVLPAAEGGD